MPKQSGLGDNLYIGGYNLSGDIGSLSAIAGQQKSIDVTGIDKGAHERIGGQRDGSLQFMAFFNPATAQAHPVLSALPIADVVAMYCRGTVLGNPSACMVGKQIDYNPTRDNSGSLTFKTHISANGYGLEWGNLLTDGRRNDTAAASGASFDGGAATSFGFQAYLQMFALTGVDVTVKLQDSADNVSFTDVAGGAFTQATTAPQAQRIAVGGTATLRRYVRAVTVTTGGFTSTTFAVSLVRNTLAVSF